MALTFNEGEDLNSYKQISGLCSWMIQDAGDRSQVQRTHN